MSEHNIATLVDFVTDYIDSTHSVRPDMLDSIGTKVRMAVIELQKQNLLPQTTIQFQSLDMKEEKRDAAGKLIYNFYRLPDDFRMLYPNGPNFEILGESKKQYSYTDYSTFIRTKDSTSKRLYTLHKHNGEYGERNRLIATPFPEDEDTVEITYYINGIDTLLADIKHDYYMPIINHVLNQMGLKRKQDYQNDVNEIKRNRNSPAGQNSHHSSFTTTKGRFFGNHRK